MITRYYSIYGTTQKNEKTRARKERSKEKKENPPPPPTRAREAGEIVDCSLEDMIICKIGHKHRVGVREPLVFKAGEQMGLTRRQCERWLEYQRMITNWHFSGGDRITCHNFRRSLRMWGEIDKQEAEKRQERKAEALARREIYAKKAAGAGNGGYRSKREAELDRLRAEGEARVKAAEEKRLKEAIQAPEAWLLCSEECEHYDPANNRCTAGCHIPPQLRSWPIPPSECHSFAPRANAVRS